MADYPDYTDIMEIIGSEIMVPMDIQAAYVMMPIDVQAAYVMMPIDLQAAYIQMPVDIQSQYVTLDINIKSQSVTLQANIYSSSVTLDVNIETSEAIINIAIDAENVTGNIAVNIAAQAADINVNITNATIIVSGSVTITGTPTVIISGTPTVEISGDVAVTIAGTINIDLKAQSVGIYSQPEWVAGKEPDKNETGYDELEEGSWGTLINYHVPANKTFYVCQWGFYVSDDVGVAGDLRKKVGATTTYLAVLGGHVGCAQSFSKPIAIPAGGYLEVRTTHFGTVTNLMRASAGGYEI